jgi:D-threo-aldose 1-dehydrogenase
MTTLPTRTLDRRGDGGVTFTELGFGTAPLGNLYRAVPEDEAVATLAAAWDAGMRYYDTAPLYGLGLSETRLNPFLRAHPREEITISTKVGRLLELVPPEKRTGIGKFFDVPSRREVYDYSYDGILRSLEFSLERLGLDAVEILYVHDLDGWVHGSRAESDRRIDQFMSSGYDALVRLRDDGVIKAFGAGVNEWQVCEAMARRGDFDVFLLAGRYTLLEQEALESFLPLCVERNIGIVLGGPYNSGILATGAKPGAFYNYEPAPQPILDRVSRIERVCAAHGVPLATAAMQFPLQHPAVVSVIPGGQRPEEVRANVAALDVAIPASLWSDLKAEGLLREDAPTP